MTPKKLYHAVNSVFIYLHYNLFSLSTGWLSMVTTLCTSCPASVWSSPGKRNTTFVKGLNLTNIILFLGRVRNSLVWTVEQMMHPLRLWSSQAPPLQMGSENTSATVKMLLLVEPIVTFTTRNAQCELGRTNTGCCPNDLRIKELAKIMNDKKSSSDFLNTVNSL